MISERELEAVKQGNLNLGMHLMHRLVDATDWHIFHNDTRPLHVEFGSYGVFRYTLDGRLYPDKDSENDLIAFSKSANSVHPKTVQPWT
jgi:hypothetical protein